MAFARQKGQNYAACRAKRQHVKTASGQIRVCFCKIVSRGPLCVAFPGDRRCRSFVRRWGPMTLVIMLWSSFLSGNNRILEGNVNRQQLQQKLDSSFRIYKKEFHRARRNEKSGILAYNSFNFQYFMITATYTSLEDINWIGFVRECCCQHIASISVLQNCNAIERKYQFRDLREDTSHSANTSVEKRTYHANISGEISSQHVKCLQGRPLLYIRAEKFYSGELFANADCHTCQSVPRVTINHLLIVASIGPRIIQFIMPAKVEAMVIRVF